MGLKARLGFLLRCHLHPLGIQALKPFLVCGDPRPDQRAIEIHTARSRSSAAASARVRQSAACSQHSLGVGKAVHEKPEPQTGTARGCSGAGEASRFSGSCHPHSCSVETVGRLGVRAHTVIPHQLTERSASDYLSRNLLPQPHSQVMEDGIASSSLAVDLF
jgi:hypothetical protein